MSPARLRVRRSAVSEDVSPVTVSRCSLGDGGRRGSRLLLLGAAAAGVRCTAGQAGLNRAQLTPRADPRLWPAPRHIRSRSRCRA